MTEEVPVSVRLAAARKTKEALLRRRALREAYGLHFYRPHLKQHKFHTSNATGRYVRFGNRGGKSEMGVAEDCAWAYGGRVWYEKAFDVKDGEGKVVYHHPGGDDHPFVRQGIPFRPVKILILCENWKKAKQVFTNRDGSPDMWGKLFKMIPQSAVGKVTRSTGGDIIQIEVKRPERFGGGASTITIDTVQSYKNAPQSAESADWDAVHVDEPCPEEMFIAHTRGLSDRNGRYWFTCTPLEEMWINDKFTPPGQNLLTERALDKEFKFEVEGETVTRYIITGSIFDNPYRNAAGVAEFMSGLNEEDKECRIYGYPRALAGAVYREFIYDTHVLQKVPALWDDFHLPPKNYTIRVAWDVHGARRPQALMFIATAPDGTAFVYDEMFSEPLILPNIELLKRKLEGRFVASRLIDPKAFIVNPVTNTADMQDLLESHELYFDKGSKDMVTGISATKEKLKERQLLQPAQPTIYFSPRLTETLFEFSHYVYDLAKGEPIDKDDHMMENLRRLILNDLDYIEPPKASDYVQRKPAEVSFYEDQRESFSNISLN